MRISHVIPTLGTGGAERLLVTVASGEARAGHTVQVITLDGSSAFGDELRTAGVQVVDLQALGRGPLRAAFGVLRWGAKVVSARGDAIVGWLYHGALLASFARPGAGRRIASIHHRDPRDPGVKTGTRKVFDLTARRSNRLDAAVYVSTGSRDAHAAAGLTTPAHVIPAGVDASRFTIAEPAARASARAGLGIAADAPVVAHVARIHPDKGQEVLLAGFAALRRTVPDAVLLVAGTGWEPSGDQVGRLAEQAGVDLAGVTMLGELSDLSDVLAAADVFCLSSHTEALPVSLVEAMASGLVPVVTAVGGCPEAVGEVGVVVPAADPGALASGLVEGLTRAAAAPGAATAVRERAVHTYGEQVMLDGYARLVK